MAAGRRELERGRAVRARDLLDRAIQLRPGHPENAVAYNLLGLAHYALGDVGAAARAFEESRRLDPDLPAPLYNLGCLYRQSRQYDRAIELLLESARLAPDDPRPLEMIGRIHADHQQWNDAANRWQEALERDPRSPRVLTSLAEVALHRHGPPAAIQYLVKALESDRRYAPALYNLYAIHAFALNDPAAAEPYARQFLDHAPPEDPRAAGARAWLESRTGVQRASIRSPPTPPVPTAADVRAVEAPTPPPAPTPSPAAAPVALTPAAMIDDAVRLAEHGRTADAVRRFLDAAAHARQAGDAADEERALKTAVRTCPEEGAAHLALGLWHEQRRQFDAARRTLAEAAAKAPTLAEAHRALARVALAANSDDVDTAVLSLRKLLQLEPDDAEARWTLARLYDDTLHMAAHARREYEEFARRFPHDSRTLTATERMATLAPPPSAVAPPPPAVPPPATARSAPPPDLPPPPGRRIQFRPPERRNVQAATEAFNRAFAHHRRGDLDRAAQEYIRALEMDDQYVLAFYNLGDVYRQKNDWDLARDAYRRALQLSPENASARYNLAYVLDLLGETAATRDQLAYLIQQNPSHAGAHYLLGLILSRDPGTHAAARQAFRRFVELAPNDSKTPGVRQWLARHPGN